MNKYSEALSRLDTVVTKDFGVVEISMTDFSAIKTGTNIPDYDAKTNEYCRAKTSGRTFFVYKDTIVTYRKVK